MIPLVMLRSLGALLVFGSLAGCGQTSAEHDHDMPGSGGGGSSATPNVDARPAPEGCDGYLLVPDAALATGLRKALEIEAGEPIRGSAVAAEEYLSLNGFGIADLSGLECATSVRQLSLDDNQITDLSIVAGLPRLTHLSVSKNQIESLGLLSDHAKLFSLGAADNRIASTANLNDLPGLRNLDLSGNPLEELEGLDGFGQLFSFRVERTNVKDFGVLARFPALDNAHFAQTPVTSLSTLPSLPSLTLLAVTGAKLEDAAIGVVLPALEHLYLDDNQITSLAALDPANVPALINVRLDRNPLTDTAPLALHPKLSYVMLNEIGAAAADLSWLTELDALTTLWASGNSIVDLEPLRGKTHIKLLDLTNNSIADASALGEVGFDRCAELSITGNPGESSFGSLLDALCASDVKVTGYCMPEACDPCSGGGLCGD